MYNSREEVRKQTIYDHPSRGKNTHCRKSEMHRRNITKIYESGILKAPLKTPGIYKNQRAKNIMLEGYRLFLRYRNRHLVLIHKSSTHRGNIPWIPLAQYCLGVYHLLILLSCTYETFGKRRDVRQALLSSAKDMLRFKLGKPLIVKI